MSYCGECGTEDLVNNEFCTNCGEGLTQSTKRQSSIDGEVNQWSKRSARTEVDDSDGMEIKQETEQATDEVEEKSSIQKTQFYRFAVLILIIVAIVAFANSGSSAKITHRSIYQSFKLGWDEVRGPAGPQNYIQGAVGQQTEQLTVETPPPAVSTMDQCTLYVMTPPHYQSGTPTANLHAEDDGCTIAFAYAKSKGVDPTQIPNLTLSLYEKLKDGFTDSTTTTTFKSYESTQELINNMDSASPIPLNAISPAGKWGKYPNDIIVPDPNSVPPVVPPKKLQYTDLFYGKGIAAKPGDSVFINDVYTTFKDPGNTTWVVPKQPLDGSNWLKNGEWISLSTSKCKQGRNVGLCKGIIGMKVGGRRELIIPASLAKGAKGDLKNGIAPDDTIIIIIDLFKVTK